MKLVAKRHFPKASDPYAPVMRERFPDLMYSSSMSRSRRKTPIFGNAHAHSESVDKKTWHSKFRTVERTQLRSTLDLGDYVAPDQNAVGPVWKFGKDGKRYFGLARQLVHSRYFSQKGKTELEQQSLARRYLAKLKGK